MRDADIWKVITEVDTSEAETAEYIFGELGALGSQEEEATRPSVARITAYFDSRKFARDQLRDLVAASFSRFPGLAGAWLEVDLEPTQDWNAEWHKFFKPFAIAENIIVVPSWENYSPKPDETLIHIDPGTAFGTGLHETTRLCAEALLKWTSSRARESLSLMDLGTGSGILAIMARKLGIGKVVGVDNDPLALDVARRNLEKNGCTEIELHDDIASTEGQYDIVVANILLSTLVELEPLIADRVARDGIAILSGIMLDQEEEIGAAYADRFALLDTARRGEWAALTLGSRG